MSRMELDSSAFEQVSLHDVRVYALVFQRLEHQGNLVLDIDYLAEWNCSPDGGHEFLVVPATLTFIDMVDLEIHLGWGTSVYRREPYGVICCPSGELIVDDCRRAAYTDPVYIDKSGAYFRYELDFWEPKGGRISLGARDFKLIGRQDGVRSSQQTLDFAQRTPLMPS